MAFYHSAMPSQDPSPETPKVCQGVLRVLPHFPGAGIPPPKKKKKKKKKKTKADPDLLQDVPRYSLHASTCTRLLFLLSPPGIRTWLSSEPSFYSPQPTDSTTGRQPPTGLLQPGFASPARSTADGTTTAQPRGMQRDWRVGIEQHREGGAVPSLPF